MLKIHFPFFLYSPFDRLINSRSVLIDKMAAYSALKSFMAMPFWRLVDIEQPGLTGDAEFMVSVDHDFALSNPALVSARSSCH